jgi:large subunit ribosomal protein L22
MEITAQLHLYRQSPRKMRLVADSIRGLNAKKALDRLYFSPKRASTPIYKLVQSAIANASHNFSLNPDNLFIKKIMVDTGPTLKRWRARAFGRSAPIRKHTSHVTIILDESVKTGSDSKIKKKEDAKDTITEVKTREEINDLEILVPDQKKTPSGDDGKKSIKTKKMKGFMPRIINRKAG